MNNKKLKIYLKLYWIRILIIGVLSIALILTLIVSLIGLYHFFFTVDPYTRKSTWAYLPFNIFLYLVIGSISAAIHTFMWIYFVFGGGLSRIGQKRIKPETVNIKWSDVIGMDAVKKEIWEVIRLLKDRAQIKMIGGKVIRGVLLFGPPGCGKTYLAKAIATETNLPFLHAVGSEFIGTFVGLGASRLRNLFKEARALAELHGGCIIFLDEIDTIARPRMEHLGLGAGMDYNATLNQLLTEMDGLAHSDANIVVIAATNVSPSNFDEALMRAGRFDRKIFVPPPGLKDREEIFKYYLYKINYDKNTVDISKLARLTVGNSAADIANIVRESSLIAVRKRKMKVGIEELFEAYERISLGIKTEKVLSERDKLIASYHEAGHAIVAYLLVPTQDVFKASIIPRERAGGVTWIMEKQEILIPNKEDLLGNIKIFLGGYVAEKIRFGITSTGPQEDLIFVNKLAERMVTEWGMGTSGAAGISNNNLFLSETAKTDKETIINNCLNEVNELLTREKNLLDDLAQILLQKEELNYDELEEIFKKHGKSRSLYLQLKIEKKDRITFEDVVGMDEVKEEAKEIVALIKDRALLNMVGGKIIRGLLMFGPPGCGKTYLASAIANEAEVPFISRAGSEFVELYVGVGASRIRQLFQEAKELALSKGGCIIFIDEIDALGAKRETWHGGGSREYNQTLNQLLVEMDGLKGKDVEYNIIVIGATNLDENFLDPALLRPGRFDRKIYIDLPTYEDRKKIFAYYLNKVKYNPQEINIDKLASITSFWSPADISNLIRESALLAVRNKKEMIGIKELEEARERIELGLKRKLTRSPEGIKKTAYHEAGHCIAIYYIGKGRFPFKISIIPRKETSGIAWYGLEKDISEGSKEEILGIIKTSLAGYAAEKLKFGTTCWGVSSDLEKATSYAYKMVWELGMGKSGIIGNFKELAFSDGRRSPLISDELKYKLDMEAQEILKECLKEIEKILTQEMELLDALAEELLKKEELIYSELEEIFKKYAKKQILKT